jgi:predicted nucleic acid-binding protein
LTALLLDASVWIASANTSQRFHSEADTLIESSEPVAALDLTLFEVANVIGSNWGLPKRARWILDTLLTRCNEQIVRVDQGLIVAALDHAAEHGLTAYDAAYVAVAKRNGWTLVSTDIADLVSKGLAVAPDAAV